MPTGTQPLPSDLSRAVGRILTSAIAAHPAPQFRIAREAGMSPAQLSRALAGKKVITLDQLDSLCDVLGLDLVDVVGEADRQSSTRTRHAPLHDAAATNVDGRADDYALAASEDDDWQARQEAENE